MYRKFALIYQKFCENIDISRACIALSVTFNFQANRTVICNSAQSHVFDRVLC
jgi:hypothetical protein